MTDQNQNLNQEEHDDDMLGDARMITLATTANMEIAEKVGNISLRNQGGFVAEMHFQFIDSQGNSSRLKGSGRDITLGKSDTRDPGDFGLADGTLFTVHARVKAGDDNTGVLWLRYEKGNRRTARFTICGTTKNNHLGLNGILA